LEVRDAQVRLWLVRPLRFIAENLKDLIEETPPELTGDIHKNGIYMCGGGSLLRGIDDLIEREIGVHVKVVEDPLNCVARGAGMVTDDLMTYAQLLSNFSREGVEKG
jgi:rod shape-determining protein MreB